MFEFTWRKFLKTMNVHDWAIMIMAGICLGVIIVAVTIKLTQERDCRASRCQAGVPVLMHDTCVCLPTAEKP